MVRKYCCNFGDIPTLIALVIRASKILCSRKEVKMTQYQIYEKELDLLEMGKSKYEWDELEELITDDFEEEKLTSDEFDELMKKLMSIECE